MDHQDKRILQILQNDGRASASFISENIGLSIPTVSDRIKKMLDLGIIKGFQAIVDSKVLGYDVAAFITIVSESSANFHKVIKNAEKNILVLNVLLARLERFLNL